MRSSRPPLAAAQEHGVGRGPKLRRLALPGRNPQQLAVGFVGDGFKSSSDELPSWIDKQLQVDVISCEIKGYAIVRVLRQA
jgi:hypothetical protein